MPERQFGPYRLVRQIAVGGMAEIHLARAHGIEGFEKYVALKMIHPNFSEDQQFIQMLIDEAKITVQLQHVNIAQTFDLGRVGDTYYITMEYVDGPDLYKLLRLGSERDVDVPLAIAAFVAKEVATGLDYAHRKRDMTGRSLGIVHRDVSPQNVLVSHAGEVKIVDFGIAKATMRARQTQAGVIKGKYYYMSPEQAWGDHLDPRSDIFSTGILLYEMLTGQMLYLEEDVEKLLDMVRRADIPPPSTLRRDVPPQLEHIAMRALAKKPEDRYPTAAAMASDLERYLHRNAPVFTATRIAQWVQGVLGDVAPEPPEEPVAPRAPSEPGLGFETKRLTRDQLVLERGEFEDENSIIFNVSDMEAAESPVAPPIDLATSSEPAAEPGGERNPEDPTRAFESPLHDDPSFLDDVEERTVISGPPGFAADTIDTEAGPEHGELPPSAHGDRADTPTTELGDSSDFAEQPTLPPAPIGEDDGQVEDGETRIDDLALEETSDPDAEQTVGERPNWHRAPALDAGNPKPAVSALRQPRRSRRTPAEGHPATPNARATLRPSQPPPSSVLSTLLDGPSRPPRVAVTDAHPTAAATPARPDAPPLAPPQPSHALQGYPPPQGYPPLQPGAPRAPLPAPQRPPPSHDPIGFAATARLSALEVDELPDAYKLSGKKSGHWIWLLLALCLLGAAGGFAAIMLADEEATRSGDAVLTIVSSPEGARVLIDGEALGEKTPTELRGAEIDDTYRVTLDLDGYKRWQKDYTVKELTNTLVARLDRITVEIKIESEPSDAEVFLNGKSMGRTPLSLSKLSPEQATDLELRKPGFRPVVQKLSWADRTELELEVELVE